MIRIWSTAARLRNSIAIVGAICVIGYGSGAQSFEINLSSLRAIDWSRPADEDLRDVSNLEPSGLAPRMVDFYAPPVSSGRINAEGLTIVGGYGGNNAADLFDNANAFQRSGDRIGWGQARSDAATGSADAGYAIEGGQTETAALNGTGNSQTVADRPNVAGSGLGESLASGEGNANGQALAEVTEPLPSITDSLADEGTSSSEGLDQPTSGEVGLEVTQDNGTDGAAMVGTPSEEVVEAWQNSVPAVGPNLDTPEDMIDVLIGSGDSVRETPTTDAGDSLGEGSVAESEQTGDGGTLADDTGGESFEVAAAQTDLGDGAATNDPPGSISDSAALEAAEERVASVIDGLLADGAALLVGIQADSGSGTSGIGQSGLGSDGSGALAEPGNGTIEVGTSVDAFGQGGTQESPASGSGNDLGSVAGSGENLGNESGAGTGSGDWASSGAGNGSGSSTSLFADSGSSPDGADLGDAGVGHNGSGLEAGTGGPSSVPGTGQNNGTSGTGLGDGGSGIAGLGSSPTGTSFTGSERATGIGEVGTDLNVGEGTSQTQTAGGAASSSQDRETVLGGSVADQSLQGSGINLSDLTGLSGNDDGPVNGLNSAPSGAGGTNNSIAGGPGSSGALPGISTAGVTGQSGTGQGGQTVSVFGSDTGIGNAALGADGQAKPSTGTAQGNGTIDGTAFTGTSNGDGSSGLGQETSGLSGQGDGLLGTALTGSLDRDTGFGFFGTDFGSQGAVASSTLDGSTGIESLASGSRFGSSAPVPAPVAPAFVSTGSDAVGQSIGLSGASGASLPDLAPDSDAFVDQFLEMSQPELAQPALEQFVSNALPEQIPHIASSIPETAEEFITSSDNIAEISESVEFADDVAQADVPVPEDPFGEETETAAFEGGAGLDGGFEENGLDDFADTAGSEDAFADAGQLGEDFGDGGFVSDSQAFAGDGSVGDTDSLGQEVDTAETGFDTGTGSDEVFDDRVDDLLADLVSDGLGDDQSNLGDSFEMAGEIGQTDSFETSDEIGGEVDSGSFEDSSGFEEEGSATFADDGDAGFEEVLADAEGNVDEIDEEGFATDQAELDQDEDFTDVDSFAENGGDEFDIALANDGFEKENGQPVLESTVEESDLEDFDSGGGEFIDGGEVQSQDAFTEEEGISNEFDIAEGDTSFEEDDFSEQDGFETEENLAGSDPDLMSDDTPNDFDTAMTAGDPEGFGRGNEEALLDPFAASDEPVNAEEDFADLEDSQDSFSDSDEGLSDQIADVEPVEADPEPDQLALADVEALSPETEANASPPTEQEDTAAETPENDDMAAAMSTLGGRNHMFATTDFNKVLRIENDLDSGRRTRDQLTQEETNVLAQAEMINDYIYNNHRTLNEDFDQTQEIMSDVERANNQTNADLAESFDDVVNAQEVLVGLRTAQLAGEVVQLISPVIDRVTTTVEIAGSAYEASSFVKKTNLATGVTEITARQTRGIQLTVKKTTTVESLADLMPQGVKNLDFGAKSINLARDILPSQSGNEATLTAGSSATGQQFAQQLRQGAGQSGTAARDQVGSSTQQTPAQSSAAFISRRSEQAANFSSVAAGGAEILANQLPNAGSGLSNFGNTAAAVGTGFSTLQHGARAYETGDVGSGITAGAYAVDTGLNLYNGVSKFRGGTGLLRLGRIANLGGAVDAGFNLYKDSAELIRLNNSGPVRVTNSQQARREAALEGRVAYMRYLRNRGRQRP